MRALGWRAWTARAVSVVAAAGLLGASGVAAAPSASAAPPPFVLQWPYSQGAPMNEFNANGLQFWGMDIEPLAFTTTNLTTFTPALAQSWKLSDHGRVLTVQLRSNDRYSNGETVTAQDVKAAWALMFISGWVQGDDTSGVNVLGPHTIQFTRFATPDVTWEAGVLSEGVEAPFVYEDAGYLPKDAWTLIQESLYTGKNPADLALAKKAEGDMGKLAVKIAALVPKVDISDGPWTLDHVNVGEEVWERNPYFFNNKENHLSTVIIRNGQTAQEAYSWVLSGQTTFSTGAFPLNVKEEALKTPGVHLAFQQIGQFCALDFNEHDYPFNMVQVRQALAYVMNRHTIQKIAEPVTGTYSQYQTGMTDAQASQWLSKSTLNALNPYNQNPAKASSLLKSVGFKKENGEWVMPNGKPFTISIYAEAGYADYDEAASVLEDEFDNFGIATKVYEENLAEYGTDQADGDYAVSFEPSGGNDLIYPQAAYDYLYFEYDGWTVRDGVDAVRLPMGNVKGSSAVAPRQYDIPTYINVPGVGRVEPAVLENDLTLSPKRSTEVGLLTKLAETTDYWLPQINLFDQDQALFYNTSQFTDWPSATSPLQNYNNVFQSFAYWAQFGWLKPRS